MNRSIFFRILTAVIVALVMLPIATTLLLRFSDTREWLINSFQSVAGGQVEIGDIGIRWKARPELVLEDFAVRNPRWQDNQEVFKADTVSLALDLSSLLTGSLLVDQANFVSAELSVDIQNGSHNFQFNDPDSDTKRAVLPDFLRISSLTVVEGLINVTHNGKAHKVFIEEAELFSESRQSEIEVDVRGTYLGLALEMSGAVGSVDTLISRAPSKVAVSGHIVDRANRFAVSGTVADLIGWRGLDLQGSFNIADMTGLTGLLDTGLPGIESVSVNLEISQPGAYDSLSFESVIGTVKYSGLEITTSGRVGDAIKLSGLELEAVVSGQWTQEGWDRYLAAPLTVNATTQVQGSWQMFEIDVINATFGLPGLTAQAAGTTTVEGGLWESPLQISAQVESYSFLHAPQPGAYESVPSLAVSGGLRRDESGYHLEDISIVTTDSESGGQLQAMGAIDDLGINAKGVFDISGQFDPRWVRAISDHPVTVLLGSVELNAQAQWQQGMVHLPTFTLSARDRGGALTASGMARDLLGDRIVESVVEGRTINLKRVADVLEWKVPDLGGLDINASIAGNRQDGYTLQNVQAESLGQDLDADFKGKVHFPGGKPGGDLEIDMGLNVTLKSENVLDAYVDAPGGSALLSKLVPIKVDANVRGVRSQNGLEVDVEDIVMGSRAGGMDIAVLGSVKDVLDPGSRSGDFDIAVSGYPDRLFDLVTDVRSLRWLFASGLDQGRLRGGAHFGLSGEEMGFTDVDLMLESEDAVLTAGGSTGAQHPFDMTELEVSLKTESLATLFPGLARRFNLNHPAYAVFRAEDLATLSAVEFDIEVVDSDLSGSVHWNPGDSASDELSMNIELTSDRLDLAMFDRPDEKGERMFSDTPLKMDWLVQNNFRIAGHIEELNSRRFKLGNATIQGGSDDGEFNVSILGRSGRDEVVSVTLGVLPVEQGYAVDASIKGFNVAMGALKHSTRWNENEDSEFSVDMAIAGEGQSLQEIMAGSNGHMYLEVINARVHNRALTFISRDLLLGILREVNPLAGRRDYFDVECGVIHLDISEGQAVSTHGFAIKTNEFALLGGGGIDFDSEAIEAVITSKARTGLGINTNTIANVTRVGGTLNNPEIEANPSGLFRSGITIWAGILSGGLSLIAQGLVDRVTANSDVCDLAADRKAPPSGPGQAAPEDSK